MPPIVTDLGYDFEEFVDQLGRRKLNAKIERKKAGNAVDGRTPRGKGYGISLGERKRTEDGGRTETWD